MRTVNIKAGSSELEDHTDLEELVEEMQKLGYKFLEATYILSETLLSVALFEFEIEPLRKVNHSKILKIFTNSDEGGVGQERNIYTFGSLLTVAEINLS